MLRHEAVGHYGMMHLLGSRWTATVAQVQKLAQTDAQIGEIASNVALAYANESADVQAMEVIAKLAESNPQHSLVQRVLAWMREAMRKLGFKLRLTTNDLVAMLRKAEPYNQQGRVAGQPMAARKTLPNLEPNLPDVVYHATYRDVPAGEIPSGEYAGSAQGPIGTGGIWATANPRYASYFSEFAAGGPVSEGGRVYPLVSLAALRIRHRDGRPAPGTFTLPGGPLIPVLSCVVVAWLLWQLTRAEALGLASLMGGSIALYAARRLTRVVSPRSPSKPSFG